MNRFTYTTNRQSDRVREKFGQKMTCSWECLYCTPKHFKIQAATKQKFGQAGTNVKSKVPSQLKLKVLVTPSPLSNFYVCNVLKQI